MIGLAFAILNKGESMRMRDQIHRIETKLNELLDYQDESYVLTPEDAKDIEKLVHFLKSLENKLGYFISNFHELMPEEKEIAIIFKDTRYDIKHRFVIMQEYLFEKNPIQKLRFVGLTGQELLLKLSVVDLSEQELEELILSYEDVKESENETEIENKKQGLREKLEQFFDHADTVMGSLGEAGIPGAGAAGEAKTVGEKILAWIRKSKK